MVDLRRLRALRELADRGTMAAAADALHLTASAVSQQLATLEREVGARLVEPDGRSVRLTSTAQVLLAHADVVFAQLERLQADLAAHAAGEVGEVRVGAFASAITGLVVPALPLLAQRAPQVTVRVRDVEVPEATAEVARGELDLVLTMECSHAPSADDSRYFRRPLLRDVLDAALPAGHPLAAAPAISLTTLAGERWVGPPDGMSCDQVIRTACQGAGFSPRVEHRSPEWGVVLALVGAGLGVALVPRLAQLVPPPGVALRPLAGQAPCRHVFAACRRGAEEAPTLRAVLGALEEAARGHLAEPVAVPSIAA